MRFDYSSMTEGFRSERPIPLSSPPELNKTESAVIWLSAVAVYSFGVMFSVSALTRQSDLGLTLGADDHVDPTRFASILFGVELGDGTKLAIDRRGPRGVVLEVRSSNGNTGSLHGTIFLGPVPPPGPVRIVTAIPRLGVSEAAVTLDGNHIIEASEQVERLWTAPPPSQGLGGAGLRGGSWFSRLD